MKNILITFISYDQDSFNAKKGDVDFMYSHRPALKAHGLIGNDEIKLDQRKYSTEKLRAELRESHGGKEGKPLNLGDILTKDDIWRPTVALSMGYDARQFQEELHFDEIYILHDRGNERNNHDKLIDTVLGDVDRHMPPGCKRHDIAKVFNDAWNIFEVYQFLFSEFQKPEYHQTGCRYYVNITSGTNAIKNSLFLLTQERVIDARRIMPHPWNDPRTRNYRFDNGGYKIEDPADFDLIYSEIRKKGLDRSIEAINRNIETQDPEFSKTLTQIAKVASITRNPILLTGPTGAGKTQIARNIFAMLQGIGKIEGGETRFQHINCATLGGDPNISYSTLFGHVRGSYTGADTDEDGALKLADGGILFLDEIGTLGFKEQAMLLTAIERKEFRPLGASADVKSDFMLICGTNANLWEAVENREFRRDLLERINLWHFNLPGLRERHGEIMHQCQIFLDETYPRKHRTKCRFANAAAREEFKRFIEGDYGWPGNFRELNAILERMCEMSVANQITLEVVREEIERTRRLRSLAETTVAKIKAGEPAPAAAPAGGQLRQILGDEDYEKLPALERVQLDYIAEVCHRFSTLEELGSHLYGGESKDGKRYTVHRWLKKRGLSFRGGRLQRSPAK